MATPAWVKDLLRGGLPEVLDLGDAAPATQETAHPERIAPTDITDRERANMRNGGGIMNASSEQILTMTALVVGGIFVLNMLKGK